MRRSFHIGVINGLHIAAVMSCLAMSIVHAADNRPAPGGQLISIENKGMLISACTLPGETPADDVAAGHGSCVRASKDRWIIVYQTRSWRGVDDERSIRKKSRFAGRITAC